MLIRGRLWLGSLLIGLLGTGRMSIGGEESEGVSEIGRRLGGLGFLGGFYFLYYFFFVFCLSI
jgi:hypothetical protein